MISDEVVVRKPLFAKDWTPHEADTWSRHDVFAAILSSACYLLVAVGVAGALLLKWWGFVGVAGALVTGWLMFKVIDPKLQALSDAFEEAQAGHLERVESVTRWEGH